MIRRAVLAASVLGLSWLAMQAVHELGHVLGAVATGGRVVRVVLDPTTFSRTVVEPNPHPGGVAWAGPLVGTVMGRRGGHWGSSARSRSRSACGSGTGSARGWASTKR